MAMASAVDFTASPSAYSASYGVSTNLVNTIHNTATVSLTSFSFTVAPSDSNVLISYPSAGTKSIVGTVAVNATGYGDFYVIGTDGTYTLYFTYSYKKGVTTYSGSSSATLTITGSGGWGKRAEGEIAERTGDITITPTSYSCTEGVGTWVNLYLQAGTSQLKNLSFAVAPSDSSVLIGYPATGNYIGTVNANQLISTSFAITGPLGTYTLYIAVQYRKGVSSTWLNAYVEAALTITGASSAGKRSELDLDVAERYEVDAVTIRNNDGSLKVEYIAGFAVGMALLAGVAVGAAVYLRKRNDAVTLA